MTATGREPSFDSEVASVGLPVHRSHRESNDCKTPDSSRLDGCYRGWSSSLNGQKRTVRPPTLW